MWLVFCIRAFIYIFIHFVSFHFYFILFVLGDRSENSKIITTILCTSVNVCLRACLPCSKIGVYRGIQFS